jgi:sugar phosphate isomerase/epimerase
MSRPKLSVQLYSVRDHVAADLDLTLDKLAKLGFEVVEPFGLPSDSAKLKSALDRAGLSAPTAHASVLYDPAAAISAAIEVGTQLLIEPYQPESFFQSKSELLRLADQLSAASALARAQGISVAYHNHDHEIRNEVDGVPALVALARETTQELLFEVDLFWCEQAHTNPVDVIQALDHRVAALHAKDAPKGAGVSGQVPLGQGDVRILASLASAPDARVVIEFDEFAGDLYAAIGASKIYLQENGIH